MPHRIFAIDLGSTNTVVARADGDETTILAVPGLSQTDEPLLPPLIPSQLFVRDAQAIDLLVGQQVRDAGLADSDEDRLVTGFKRRVAAEIPGLDPEVDGVEVTSQRAASWFLGAVLRALPDLDKNSDQVVFTVPVGSFQRYLAWLESFWPVRHWRVVDESTAAALGYDVAEPGARVLTCDLGGGTIDLSLVRIPEQFSVADQPVASAVIAKASQILGGDDIDAWLLEHLAERLDWAPEHVAAHRASLRRAAERVKIRLSNSFTAIFDGIAPDGKPADVEVTRDELEEVLIRHDFLTRLQAALETAMRQAVRKGIDKDRIDHVLLVGGTGQIPAVRRVLQSNFGADKVHSDHVFTAAARGAARLGLGVEVEDILFHSYAVRGWNHAARRHEYDLVVPALSRYPFEQPVVREYAASTPNQAAMELFLGEIEHADVSRPEVIVEDRRIRIVNAATAVQRYALVDADRAIPLNNGTTVKLDPPGQPGIGRVRVEFMVDAQRRLRLTVIDLQTNFRLLEDQAVATLT